MSVKVARGWRWPRFKSGSNFHPTATVQKNLATKIWAIRQGPMEYDTRWRVAYASDLAVRTVTFDAGEIFLRHDTQRIALLNSRGHTVDARYVHEGERIDVGSIVSFPCHFAKIWDRLPVVGTSRGGAQTSTGEAAAQSNLVASAAAYGDKVAIHARGPPRPPPHLDAGPGILGRGPDRHEPDPRHVLAGGPIAQIHPRLRLRPVTQVRKLHPLPHTALSQIWTSACSTSRRRRRGEKLGFLPPFLGGKERYEEIAVRLRKLLHLRLHHILLVDRSEGLRARR